jgi:hypothetical protein
MLLQTSGPRSSRLSVMTKEPFYLGRDGREEGSNSYDASTRCAITRAALVNADLNFAVLSNAFLDGANLRDTFLDGTDLTGAEHDERTQTEGARTNDKTKGRWW